jgi:hypothetical protein
LSFGICFLLFLIVVSPSAAIDSPPEGWRFPVESDYSGDWQAFSKDLLTPFHVGADFNGDRILDEAWILIRTRSVGWGLFVFLSQKDGKTKTIQLQDRKGDSNPQRFGIKLVLPGKYKTACGKGYWECKRGEPEVLELSNPAFEFFLYESSSSIYFWDKKANTFKQIFLSD